MSIPRVCAAVDCTRKHYAKGYCKVHYERLRRNGTLERLQESHGYGTSREYKIWVGIIQRTTNHNSPAYNSYGGRGIRVCERWRLSFSDFLEDMGARPSKEYSVDRIDNNGNYEPGNCRWATRLQQAINRRMNRNNTSGITGVAYRASDRVWWAQIGVDGRTLYLGRFKTQEKAVEARRRAEAKYFNV
jgi:hypothetical protein